MKISFNIYTEPENFDTEDSLINLLQDDGIVRDLEGSLAREIGRIYGGGPRFMARVKSKQRKKKVDEFVRDLKKSRGVYSDTIRVYPDGIEKNWVVWMEFQGEECGNVSCSELVYDDPLGLKNE